MSQAHSNATEAAIWSRVIHPNGELTAPVARDILKLHFPETDLQRMEDLLDKAKAGVLSEAERLEAENYERVGALLSILKSKARKVLKRSRSPRAS